jgi:hypothetical protein
MARLRDRLPSAALAVARTPSPLRVSRASLIARRHRAINGEPCSSGHSARVPARQQNPGCRLVPALELRRSTRSGEDARTATIAAEGATRMCDVPWAKKSPAHVREDPTPC